VIPMILSPRLKSWTRLKSWNPGHTEVVCVTGSNSLSILGYDRTYIPGVNHIICSTVRKSLLQVDIGGAGISKSA
jgi:hypothetical protein